MKTTLLKQFIYLTCHAGYVTKSHFIMCYLVGLQSLIKLEGWESLVTIVSSDMRCWNAPEKADILVISKFVILFYSSYYRCLTSCTLFGKHDQGKWAAWFLWRQWIIPGVPWWSSEIFEIRWDFYSIPVCSYFCFFYVVKEIRLASILYLLFVNFVYLQLYKLHWTNNSIKVVQWCKHLVNLISDIKWSQMSSQHKLQYWLCRLRHTKT